MFKKLSIVFLLVFLSFVSLNGCDTQDQAGGGCGSNGYDYSSDEIEFKLPPASNNGIASYQVDLLAPVSKEILASQEGVPGETLIFTLDRPMVYVPAILTAIDASGNVLDEAKVAVVDVDVMVQVCDVTVDTTAGIGTGTTVDVNVECFGKQFADVHVDTRK